MDTLTPGQLTLAQLRRLAGPERVPVRLDPACRHAIRASAAVLCRAAEGDAPVYGVNTGFGKLASQRIGREDLAQLQLNLLRSHAVGVGEPLPERVVRLVLLLKAASLARGYSGVREEVIDGLIELHNRGVLPVIPCQGSVGASGDLAPLAHLCLPLIGEGEAWFDGHCLPGGQALERAGLKPLKLGPKEGLALINGTQVSTALALDALLSADKLFEAAVITGALTLDAARGSDAACGRGGPAHPRRAKRRRGARADRAGAAAPALLSGPQHPWPVAPALSHARQPESANGPVALRCDAPYEPARSADARHNPGNAIHG
mgnify:CR=1 FL=1